MSFAIDWWRGDGSPVPFMQTNLLIHCLNSLLVLLFSLQVLRAWRPGQALLMAFAVAALWALHPVQVQAVSYAVQRMTSMATFFMLLSVIGYIQGRQPGAHRYGWFILSLLAFICGAISKEIAWITPLLIWLVEYGLIRQGRPLLATPADRILFVLPFIATLLVTLDIASGSGPLSQQILPGYAHRDFTLEERLLTQPRVIALHLSQLVWPMPGRFTVEHDVATSVGLLNPPATLAALASLILWCSAGLWALLRSDYRRYGFLLLWPVIGLAIESSFVPLEMAFEHRMYLPSVTLFLLVVMAATRWIPVTWIRFGLLALGCLLLASATQIRLQDWRSEILLYESATRVAPDKARVWNNLGSYYAQVQRYPEAREAFERAIALSDTYRSPLFNLAKYHLQVEYNPETALDLLNRALTIPEEIDHGIFKPVDVYLERGNAYFRLGRLTEAASNYTRALELEPDNVRVMNNRGVAFLRQKDYPNALADFTRATILQPNDDQGHRHRALVHLATGAPTQALPHARRAFQLNTGESLNALLLNEILVELGQRSPDREQLAHACRQGSSKDCKDLAVFLSRMQY